MAAVDAGWTVIGVDNLEPKVAQINSGVSPVEDIPDSQLQAAISRGSYKATTEFSEVSQATVIAICVPTPLNDNREPDLDLLRNAAAGIASYVSNETLIISESTSYPGTLREIIIPIIEKLRRKDSKTIYYACAPERVNPGDPVWNQLNTPRLIGAINDESQSKALAFYQSICNNVILVSSPEVAEAAKLLENTFRLVNIALVNEFSQLCHSSGINVQDVIDAASSKPYGFIPFRPGVGVGGHCIPIDPLYLTWWARQNGKVAELVESADLINHKMPKYVAERAMTIVQHTVGNPRILILGVAYKSGVCDVRETPVAELRDQLQSFGAVVAWHDPLVPEWEGTKPVGMDWPCDLVILATMQPGINLDQLINNGGRILDCTNTIQGQIGVTKL